ncbi:helix-turn-helix domain-containing protein [Pseudoflavitalea sp. G-6-1-2]|uniref:helix-turn-helix domain-containing protein n=1 Tax=Pseudoflavitalea sp. G-6-1-2 TaxID=2728841 RepID=UPI00146F0BCB|nr:helix-turn-helix domain-containing protein [Pseudoflavitalea sp. G-6-1-2]NML21079.1 helix-turn-helix domain-containing protein [Pseudoflavitalea sp. G-6-1-2]
MNERALQSRLRSEELIAEAAAAFLTANLQRKPTQEQVCKHVGVNEFKLKKVFKKKYKVGLFLYLRLKRMEKARLLMEESDLSISQIANMVGYSEAAFSTAFKRLYKVSPRYWNAEQDTPG